jgi:non-heme chloroperoxidase
MVTGASRTDTVPVGASRTRLTADEAPALRHGVVAVAKEVQLPYVEMGDVSGIPVVCLHGLPQDWMAFEPLFPHLPASLRVIAPSQRGFGGASRPQSGYGLGEFANDVIGLLDGLALERAVVLGHSMGSMVAQHLAIKAPDRLLGIVLVSTGLSGQPGELSDEEQELIDAIFALTDPVDPTFVRTYIDIFLPPSARPSSVSKETYEILARGAEAVPARAWHDIWRGLVEDDLTSSLDGLDLPTLIIYGDTDPFVPREDQDRLVDLLTRARLHVYAGAGHLPHWDDPERFTADLVAFVDAITSYPARADPPRPR